MYRSRYIESTIERALASSGAVLVSGPKFCGKTTTCMRFQKSFVRLNNSQVISLARIDPEGILQGEKPRLIDEWQKAPEIWDCIKAQLDEEYRFGQYLLTGSSTPVDKKQIQHSGAGRIVPVTMRTMSLHESGDSTGAVSLGEIAQGAAVPTDLNQDFALEEVAYLVCRGGWPISVLSDRQVALDVTRNYYDGLFVFEDYENEQFRGKSPHLFRAILRSYARNISSEASVKTLMDDVRQSDERAIDRKTMDSYLEALRDIFVIEDMEAWSPNIRSKTSIRSTPTRHFADASLACCALGIEPADLMGDLNAFGLFFEDMAVRDLRVYSGVTRGELFHYRDNTGLECDAVIRWPNGKWGAVEVKLGGEQAIEAGAASLNRLAEKVSQKSSEGSPAFRMVLTAVGPMYTRKDGVVVVPINQLRA
uniref:ATP-binding protein n=1 Tax=Muribaculaceae bacterium Z82 TaxID=2304548 RepID=A0A7C9JDY1_9BACT